MAPLITVQQRSQIVNDFKWVSQTPKKCQTMKTVSARQYLSNTAGNLVPPFAGPHPLHPQPNDARVSLLEPSAVCRLANWKRSPASFLICHPVIISTHVERVRNDAQGFCSDRLPLQLIKIFHYLIHQWFSRLSACNHEYCNQLSLSLGERRWRCGEDVPSLCLIDLQY